jgi:hypothetical protein
MSVYSNLATLINNDTLLQKGQKLYLEGKVLASKENLIPHWKTYGVTDNNQIYEVVAPTIHLIEADYNNIEYFKLAHCNCEYYGHMGYCHHICAVLSSLDNQYKSVDVETKVNPSLWDTLMVGEKSTVINQYKYNLNNYFEFNWDERNITKELGSLAKDLKKYPELKDILTNQLKLSSKEFVKEKKIITLFTHPYLSSQNSTEWFKIFLPFLIKINDRYIVELGLKVYLNLYSGLYQISTHNDIIKYLQSYDADQKTEISKSLQANYIKQPHVWMDYAVKSQDKTTLLKNLESFDPLSLVTIASLYPYEHDLIENKLYNQVKVWVDFLVSTDYTELLTVIEKWYLVIGKTEKFIELTEYIIAAHPKKKNLLKEIQNY